MATIRFTEDDRDSRGFIRLSPPAPAEEPNEAPPATPAPARPARPAAPPMSPRLRYQLTIAAAGVVGVLLVLLSMRLSAPRAMTAATAPAQSSAAAPALPTAPPPTAPVAMLPAYGAPNEAPRWQIESTRAITPVAHFGSDWIQADVQGSGVIWLRAADWPNLAIVGPDLAVRPTAPPIPTARPTEPPPPPPCAEAGVPGKMVSVCGYEDLSVLQEQAKQQWIEQYGGNIGIVATPSPQEWNRP